MTTEPCRWCVEVHDERHLCDAAKRVLDALYARGMEGNMPSIEFPEPITGAAGLLGIGDDGRLVSQLVVQAATVDAAGVAQPALVFTGRDPYGNVLPKWLYAGLDADMRRLVRLVTDMSSLACRTARKQRAG